MEDQFGGRTDDDLFADEFEPVEETYVEPTAETTPASAPAPEVESQPPVASTPEPPSETQSTSVPTSGHKQGTLSQSRHNPQKPHPRQRRHSPKPKAGSSTTSDVPNQSSATTSTTTPTAPSAVSKPASNAAGPNRILSGANPRVKLTEEELAKKMEAMRVLNAEKTRKFEEAERDKSSHKLAYDKGMEEARRRKAEDAEKRKKADEDRRQLDAERERNRERKLKSLGMWDQEKNLEEDKAQRGNFRSAYGGVRGERRGGLGGSRFAFDDAPESPREYGSNDFRGRGRGRPRGQRGSGGRGRGGFNGHPDGDRNAQNGPVPEARQAVPKDEDFPALPSAPKSKDASAPTQNAPAPLPSSGDNSPPVGKWDDEMAALDARAENS